MGKQQGVSKQGVYRLWELHRAFKKCITRRGENRPSRDIITTTPSVPVPVALPKGHRNGVSGVPPRKMSVRGSPVTLPPTVLQMLQRLCGRVQEEVRALRLCPLEPVQDELLYARDLIKDAKNSRAVSPQQHLFP